MTSKDKEVLDIFLRRARMELIMLTQKLGYIVGDNSALANEVALANRHIDAAQKLLEDKP